MIPYVWLSKLRANPKSRRLVKARTHVLLPKKVLEDPSSIAPKKGRRPERKQITPTHPILVILKTN